MRRRSPRPALVRSGLLLGTILLSPLAWTGFTPASAIVTAPKNTQLTEGKVAIGLREELGANTAEIEKIVRANPRVRIGWPSEFEISADPNWPNDFYLIDMNNPVASSVYRQWADVPRYDEPASAEPLFIGRLDDGTLASGLEAALRKIARRLDLIRLNRPAAFQKDTYIRIDCELSETCTGPSESLTMITDRPLSFQISVGTAHVMPQFIYILMVKPDHELEWAFYSASDYPTPPGTVFNIDYSDRPFTFDQTGKYDFITITSDTPIDPALFAPGMGGSVDRTRCRTVLERVLCRAISGEADPMLPDDPGSLDAGWSINARSTYYAKSPGAFAVGGGEAAPPGYAPWAVQIYSARPYDDDQKLIDNLRLDSDPKKRFLDQLSAGQEEHRCGGSLIAPDLVLTAAHCVVQKGVDFLAQRRVYVGSQLLRGERSAKGADYAIVAAAYHQRYVPSRDRPSPSPPHNDIALLKIRPLGRAAIARSILLPDAVPGYAASGVPDQIRVLGWGFTRVRQPSQASLMSGGAPLASAVELQRGNLQFLNIDACKRIQNYAGVNENHICAETPPPKEATRGSRNTFSCRGDSGGPVVRHLGQRTVQVGIVSWAYGCGVSAQGATVRAGQKNPSVFVNVEKYTGWIGRAKGSFRANSVTPVP